jgi:hypothetical protein
MNSKSPQAGTLLQPPKLKGPKKSKSAGQNKLTASQTNASKKTKSTVKNSVKGSGLFTEAEVERVAMALALPANSEPQRYSSEFSSLPTAIAAPWSINPAPSVGSATITQTKFEGMPNTDGFCALFRSAQRACVMYDPNPTGQAFQYVYSGVPNTPALTAPAVTWNVSAPVPGKKYWLKTPFVTSGLSYSPHGSVQYAGVSGKSDGRYFWLDEGFVTVTVTGTAANATIMALSRWGAAGESEDVVTVSHPISGSTGYILNIPAGQAGYYALSISGGVADTFGISNCSFNSVSACYRHLPIQGLPNNISSTDGIRIIAASLMYSNEASPLNKQGKITGCQIPQGDHWFDYIGNYSKFSSLQGSHSMSIDEGMYGFLKPTQPTDFSMVESLLIENGVVYDSFYLLDQTTSFLMFYWQIINLLGQDGYWTFCHGLEYQTDDVWRSVAQSQLDASVYAKAVESLKIFPQFYENPLHWGDIWNKIKEVGKSVANGVIKYAPLALKAAGMVAPLL